MITSLFEKADADKIHANLTAELQYVPRSSLTFKIFGHTFPLPRDKGFYGDQYEDGSTPIYRYGADWYPPVVDWTPTLREIRDKLTEVTGQYCNHCVVNRYISGSDHIGWHHDKVPDFEPGTSVFSVSFGAERKFQTKDVSTGEVQTYITKHGSLCTLDWETNKRVKHRIAKTSTAVHERISLTFRSIKSRRSKE